MYQIRDQEDENNVPQYNLLASQSHIKTDISQIFDEDDEKDDPTTSDEFLDHFAEDYEWQGGAYRAEKILINVIWKIALAQFKPDIEYDYEDDGLIAQFVYDPFALETDDEPIQLYVPNQIEDDNELLLRFPDQEDIEQPGDEPILRFPETDLEKRLAA